MQNKINKIIIVYSESYYYLLNLLQIQRRDLIDHICDLWKNKRNTKDYAFNFKKNIIIKNYENLNWLEKSYHYIIYKTIHIFNTYPNYNRSFSVFNEQAIGFSDKYTLNRMKKDMDSNFEILLLDINTTK